MMLTKERVFTAALIAVVLAAIFALTPLTLHASTYEQSSETFTPSIDSIGPTYTPTPTLPPPHPGGGLVSVGALAVLPEPVLGSGYIGDLLYGDSVVPLARSEDGLWIAIEWDFRENRPGWVAASRVLWDPALDILSLPVLTSPYLMTPSPDEEVSTEEPTATLGAEETAKPVPTSTHQTVAAETAEPIDTSRPTEASAPVPDNQTGETGSGLSFVQLLLLMFVVGALIYGFFFIRGKRDEQKYTSGFFMRSCPICQTGDLHLDEASRSTIGIIQMRRTVRCTQCNSVLRQVRPGAWRYSVDAYFDENLSAKFNLNEMSDADLHKLQADVELRAKVKVSDASVGAEDALDKARAVVDELEAKFIEDTKKALRENEETDSEDEPVSDEIDDQ